MEKAIQNNKVALVTAGALAAAAGISLVANGVSSYVERGLSDSQKIRVAEAAACPTVTDNTGDVRFVGCNSIL